MSLTQSFECMAMAALGLSSLVLVLLFTFYKVVSADFLLVFQIEVNT